MDYRQRLWTPEEDAVLLTLHARGTSYAAIAAALRPRTIESVHQRTYRLRHGPPPTYSYNPNRSTALNSNGTLYPHTFSVIMDADMHAAVSTVALANGSSRSEAIRTLIQWGLDSQ